MSQLLSMRCDGDNPLLSDPEVQQYMQDINAWETSNDGSVIQRDFGFNNFDKTIAFVNALAWIANQENHHPDLEVGYKHCLVRYSTHSAGGLTIYDFICAAKINALVD